MLPSIRKKCRRPSANRYPYDSPNRSKKNNADDQAYACDSPNQTVKKKIVRPLIGARTTAWQSYSDHITTLQSGRIKRTRLHRPEHTKNSPNTIATVSKKTTHNISGVSPELRPSARAAPKVRYSALFSLFCSIFSGRLRTLVCPCL